MDDLYSILRANVEGGEDGPVILAPKQSVYTKLSGRSYLPSSPRKTEEKRRISAAEWPSGGHWWQRCVVDHSSSFNLINFFARERGVRGHASESWDAGAAAASSVCAEVATQVQAFLDDLLEYAGATGRVTTTALADFVSSRQIRSMHVDMLLDE